VAVPTNNLKIPFASPHKTANFDARPELGESKKGERTGPLNRLSRLERIGRKPAEYGPTGLSDGLLKSFACHRS
jgi:hypothetical protein